MRITLLIILFSTIFAQTSSLAISGFGEPVNNIDAAAIGLGASQYFSDTKIGVSLSSPSSLWRTKLTQLNVSSSFNQLKGIDLPIQNKQLINNLSFLVPIGAQKAMSIGVQPVTRNDFYILGKLGFNPTTVFQDNYYTSVSHYSGSGGLSHFFVTYSTQIRDKFAFGAQWNIAFGSQELSDTVYTHSLSTDPVTGEIEYSSSPTDITYYTKINKFSGNSFLLEGRYFTQKSEFVLSTTLQKSLKINSITTYSSGVESPEINFESDFKILSYGAGYLRHFSDKYGGILEFHYNDYNDDFPNEVKLFGRNSGTHTGINLGLFRSIKNSKLGIWNEIHTRAGLYYTQIKHSNDRFYDFGFTLGTGVEYFKNKNSVDIAVKFGQRSSEFTELSTEKYISLTVGITTGETWFIKRKRK